MKPTLHYVGHQPADNTYLHDEHDLAILIFPFVINEMKEDSKSHPYFLEKNGLEVLQMLSRRK